MHPDANHGRWKHTSGWKTGNGGTAVGNRGGDLIRGNAGADSSVPGAGRAGKLSVIGRRRAELVRRILEETSAGNRKLCS